ncbi:MAG TPA: cation diffusion facilitator family transporter [Chitinophagales bacterium]|nr:cation diffusion facilitator family transporter [Chitinophagales bacterium]
MNTRAEVKVQRAAIIISILLMIIKFVAWYFTRSNAILTDALESIINVVAGGFALYAVILSAKPSDNDHPYGHGKVEFIVSGIEGGMIALAGILMIGIAAVGFINENEIEHLQFGLVLTALTGVVNFATAWWLISTGKKHQSLPLIADGEHIKSDAYTSFAVIAGLGLIWLTGWHIIDNVVTMLMGFWIINIGYRLVRKALAGIMDEADIKLVEEIVRYLSANRKNEWIDIHNLRVIQYGSKLHIDCHITFPFYFTLEKVHREMKEVEQLLNTKYGKGVEVFIHPDPCTSVSCKLCSINPCSERKFAFEKRVEWEVKNITTNKRHEV